jgi:hypothetical protein
MGPLGFGGVKGVSEGVGQLVDVLLTDIELEVGISVLEERHIVDDRNMVF